MADIRLLVVESNTELRKVMVEFFEQQQGFEYIRDAENGLEATHMLSHEPFDVLVTSLIMPKMDGFLLMEEMRKMSLEPMPKVIVFSVLARDDYIMRAIDHGASYYMVKPFEITHLLFYIRELFNASGVERQPAALAGQLGQHRQGVDESIGSLFLTMGIPAHIKGYQYLREAIKRVIVKQDTINRITKELYPSIGRQYQTSASKVERAIRHAIEVAWNRGRVEVLNQTFGCRVCSKEEKPTNGEFIAMIADKMRGEYGGQLGEQIGA